MNILKNKKLLFLFSSIVLVLLVILVLSIDNTKQQQKQKQQQSMSEKSINGMIMLIEFEKIDGIVQWEKELDNRNLTALIKVQDNVLSENPDVFKRLADKGYEIAGGYDEAPFWNMSYDEQYAFMKKSKELVEKTSGKKMRVFGSRYFAYDENTLKAADALDVDYVLGRGVNDVEAVIYQPREYNTKIISVSNVDVGEMGRGSLCDYSLWARGSSAADFGQMIDESIAKQPKNMILVSHAYLGGTRLEWWNEYERVLDSQKVKWSGFDNWADVQDIVVLPNNEIPINDEVKYVAPQPVKQMEEYTPIPGLETTNDMVNTSAGELMCQ